MARAGNCRSWTDCRGRLRKRTPEELQQLLVRPGEATCSAPGTVTITASAPQNLSFTVNNGVQNTSTTVSGTAMLTCQ